MFKTCMLKLVFLELVFLELVFHNTLPNAQYHYENDKKH